MTEGEILYEFLKLYCGQSKVLHVSAANYGLAANRTIAGYNRHFVVYQK